MRFGLLASAVVTLLAALWVSSAHAQVNLMEGDPAASILISAQAANRWEQGAYEVWLLRGNCRITQGADVAQCQEAVLWITRAVAESNERSKVIAYLEGNVTIDMQRGGRPVRLADRQWFGRFFTVAAIQVQAGAVAGKPDVMPEVFQRASDARSPVGYDMLHQSGVRPAQYIVPREEPPVGQPLPQGTRRVRVFPRGDVPVTAQWVHEPQTNQWVATIDQGVNVIVDGLQGIGTIDVTADRLVVWTHGAGEPDLTGQRLQDGRAPLEIYVEGNIVFRQGQRVIYADRMYYDVPNQLGTVLSAEVLTPAPGYQGLLRLRAEVLQQTGPNHFVAQDAFFTSSRLGSPRYRIQASELSYDDFQQPVVDPVTGQQAIDPLTGAPLVNHEQAAVSRNNFLYLGDVPVFYWPVMASDLRESSFYLRRARVKQDSNFGTQILTDWNVYQLLGIRRPPVGTDWDLSLDYLSKRGFGHGTTFQYHRDGVLGIPGPASGMLDYWGIFDKGTDNLGLNRRSVQPEEDYRYRLLFQHRQMLPEGYELTAEAGKISDRNFLPSFFRTEWQELKDFETYAQLKRYEGNSSWFIRAQARLNDFQTETEWLPRFDHYLMGQSLLGDRLTWFEHSSVSYARFRTASLPDPALGDEAVSHLPWEPVDREGGRFITRNEIDLPFNLAGAKVVPYALGELGYWGQDINGEQLNRAYYQAGIRASVPMWSVDPTVESALWNVHGLAHKVTFEAEFSYAQSNRSLGQLPLYEQLDDNQIEEARRRFVVNTFGLPVVPPPGTQGPPLRFDERLYALRSGLGSWVASPSMEIAEDLTVLRLGALQRWQTKRGRADCQHIVDWITLDTNVSLFPDPTRDNFGNVVGLLDYDFRWHVGDRTTIVSDGIFDFFDQGQKIVHVGAFLNRPPRGAVYAGVRIFEGPIRSQILTASYSYWMSPKWISSLGVTIDLAETNNVGTSLRLTRIGESLLISAAVNVDPVRDNFGFSFGIEPRFLPTGRLGMSTGARIPPAGAFGLE